MRTILVLLFLALPISAHDLIIAEPIGAGWGIMDSIQIWTPKRDTARHYIKEIKQKCDTTYVGGTSMACSQCPKCDCTSDFWWDIECVDDTTWAHKIQIYLTPAQLEELMEMIEVGLYWDRDTSHTTTTTNKLKE